MKGNVREYDSTCGDTTQALKSGQVPRRCVRWNHAINPSQARAGDPAEPRASATPKEGLPVEDNPTESRRTSPRTALAWLAIAAIVVFLAGDLAPKWRINTLRQMPLGETVVMTSTNKDSSLIIKRTSAVDHTAMKVKGDDKQMLVTNQLTVNRPFSEDRAPWLAVGDSALFYLNSRLPSTAPTATTTLGVIQQPAIDTEQRQVRQGISWIFPAPTEQKTYLFYDPLAGTSEPLDYDGEVEYSGLHAYSFNQTVGPIPLALPGVRDGVEYQVDRTVVVEPQSGQMLNMEESITINRGADILVNTTLNWDDATRSARAEVATNVVKEHQILAAWAWICRLMLLFLVLLAVRELRRWRKEGSLGMGAGATGDQAAGTVGGSGAASPASSASPTSLSSSTDGPRS